MRRAILFTILLFTICVAGAKGLSAANDTLPSTYVPSGPTMYKQYCAVCHGEDGKGQGPFASTLKVPPSDLTMLAKRHGGKFAYDYVSGVLLFGPGPAVLHGSSDMPTWGHIFQYFDRNNERAVQQRIKNLCNYLASLQEK